jgi:uncharacterized protein YbaA (DUF1428 family)
MNYVDGIVTPVPVGNRDAYIAFAQRCADIFIEYGALRVTECWADDINPGKINDFRSAVLAEEGEDVCYSWIEWSDKDTRNAAWEKIMADPRMMPESTPPFSGARMIYGGFTTVVDTSAG